MTRSRQASGRTDGGRDEWTAAQRRRHRCQRCWPGCGTWDAAAGIKNTLRAFCIYFFGLRPSKLGKSRRGRVGRAEGAAEDAAHLMRLNFVFILVKCIEISPSLTRQQTDP